MHPDDWSYDPDVPDDQKRAARAARWRGRLVAPDLATIGARIRFREAVAEATLEGELLPPHAAVGLKAVDDAAGDPYREKTGLPAGAADFVIERVVFAARGLPGPALPASATDPHVATGNGTLFSAARVRRTRSLRTKDDVIEVERLRRNGDAG